MCKLIWVYLGEYGCRRALPSTLKYKNYNIYNRVWCAPQGRCGCGLAHQLMKQLFAATVIDVINVCIKDIEFKYVDIDSFRL